MKGMFYAVAAPVMVPMVLMSSAAFAAEARTSSVRDNGMSYTYVQAGYENRDYDNAFETDGLDTKVSYALDEHLFVRGGLQFFQGDSAIRCYFFCGSVDDDADGFELSAGMGFHTPLVTDLDLVVSGDIVHVDYDYGDDTGFAIAGGVRHATTDKLELSGGLFFENVIDSEFGLHGSALFHVAAKVDVGAELKLGDDVTTFGVFGRYNF